MKTISNLRTGIILLAFAMSVVSCEDTFTEIESATPDLPEVQVPVPELEVSSSTAISTELRTAKPFTFRIGIIACTRTGYTIYVHMLNIEAYKISWQLDGTDLGYGNQIHCVTGRTVKVKVTRKSDRMSISRTIQLPPSVVDGLN